MRPEIKSFNNNDEVIIAWRYPKPIPGCIGFAVYRRLGDESAAAAEPIYNRIGFAGEEYKKGELRSSTEWPIQRFIWTDFIAKKGDVLRYRVVPMILKSGELIKDENNASGWTSVAKLKTSQTIGAYFNRGIVASQFFAKMRQILGQKTKGKSVKAIIEGGSSRERDFLGGYLSEELYRLLDVVIKNKSLTVYGALYELNQKDLIDKLGKIGSRASIILANGAAAKRDEDKNSDTRRKLLADQVIVHDRIVDPTKKHFAHNKFLVICKNGQPQSVWTGSTNWTPGGMFAQVNNGLLIENNRLASIYLDEWKQLKDAGNDYPDSLVQFNNRSRTASAKLQVWFSPVAETKELKEVCALMQNAKDGILFLLFNPGPKETLFNRILEIRKAQPDLFIHGVINQDPGGKNPLLFFNRGTVQKTDWTAILPKKIDKEYAFWYKEVSAGLVTIHSKVIVIDPFGDKPIVVTGSHNLGPKASAKNDENLLIIKDRDITEQYAVHVMSIYDHYRWRFSVYQGTKYEGLTKSPKWMESYMTGARFRELDFWLNK